MADNYLEKRIEEYRSGRLAARSRTSASMRAPRRVNQLSLTYPPMTVIMIADTLDSLVTEAVAAFTAVGCKVAFTSTDTKGSTALAQRSGARFYPKNVYIGDIFSDVTSRWGVPEVVVSFHAATGRVPSCPTARVIRPYTMSIFGRVSDTSVAARHLLYLAHPDNTFLLD